MTDLNNFHGYMPGGFLREMNENSFLGYKFSEEKERLVHSIDAYLKETNFDVERYLKLARIAHRCFDRFMDAIQSGDDDKAEHYRRRNSKFEAVIHPLEVEVYEHMLSLGFSEMLLTR